MRFFGSILAVLVCLAGLWGIAAHADIHPDLVAAERSIAGGKTEDALKRITKYRREYPDDPRALLLMARIENDFTKALALLKEVEILSLRAVDGSADSSLTAEVLYEQAELRYAAGGRDDAAAIHARLIERYPVSGYAVKARYRIGVVAFEDGRYEDAMTAFGLCRADTSDTATRLAAVAGIMECHVARRQWSEAIDAAREVLAVDDPESAYTPRVLGVIARSWRELGSTENAAWYTDRLVGTFPESYQAHEVRERGRQAASDIGYSDDSSLSGEQAADSGTGGTELLSGKVTEPGARTVLDAESAYTVQASAFVNRMNAYKMYTDLKQRGFEVRIEMKTVANKHFYKVLIGRFSDRGAADRMVDRVSAATGVKANVMIMEEER